jgi:hypothetical protein
MKNTKWVYRTLFAGGKLSKHNYLARQTPDGQEDRLALLGVKIIECVQEGFK